MRNIEEVVTYFIGRNKEIEIFKQWLQDPKAPWILYFHDAVQEKQREGGVGKTWLLRKCAMLAKQLRPDTTIVMIDFFDIADQDGFTVARHVVEGLQASYPGWSPTSFTQAIEQYSIPEYRNITVPESQNVVDFLVRSKLFVALAADLYDLDRQIAYEGKSLLICFDTFEIIEQNPTTAVLGPSQTFPDNYRFEHIGVIIAGRNPLDWTHSNWNGRENEVQCVPVPSFSLAETIQFINTNVVNVINTKQAIKLYERTEGRPILVGLVTDVLNHRVMTVNELIAVPQPDFESYLVSQINQLQNPLNWVILFMAHVYHRFNATVLDRILRESSLKDVVQEVSQQDLVEMLPTLSFVRGPASSGTFVLHDEMRRLVTKHCWTIQDLDQTYRKEISHCMIGYYEEQIARTQSEQERHAYAVEMLYHALFLDSNSGWKYFQERFSSALNLLETSFARTLLQEAKLFEETLSVVQRREMQLAEAKLLQLEEDALLAIELYDQLERDADQQWIEEHREEILFEKGRCYSMLSKFSEAIDCFTSCLEIGRARGDQPRIAIALNWLGFAYRKKGDYDQAKSYYEEGLALYQQLDNQSEYADTLNNLSNIYRFQGKTQEALRRCQIGLRLRQELFHAGKASEIPVGSSLSTMGIIYLDAGLYASSEPCLREAFEIFNRAGRKRELAGICNRLGQIEIKAKNNLQRAKQWFEMAEQTALGPNDEAYIRSLNRQGRLLVTQKRWLEAREFFKRAIDAAKEAYDGYQYAENLIDLAETLVHLGQDEQSNQLLKEAEDISSRWNWNYFILLGRAEKARGDICYESGEYQNAFVHYRQYCHYMARHNEMEYNSALDKVIGRLFDTPKDEFSDIVNELIAYWSAQHMDRDYASLVDALQEVKKARGFIA